jgi:glycosyltransferase involved in cell wall biosynthesis
VNGLKIHVFTSDILPLKGFPTSGGGLRSWQLIQGLSSGGFEVTYSMPVFTFLGKSLESRLTPRDRSLAWNNANQHQILDKVKPDVAIWCSVYAFSLPPNYKSKCIFVVDLHGPANIESTYIGARSIEMATKELVHKLRFFDRYVTVCDEQRLYFSAMLCAAGVPISDIQFTVVPVSIPAPVLSKRTFPKELTMIYSGGFYPWQDPSAVLLRTGQCLENAGTGKLHIFGTPHGRLSTASMDALFAQLAKMKRVILHGYVPRAQILTEYSRASCALDLMPKNLERELAFTTRTVEYLAYGVAPIYNNYAPLARPIRDYDAGWCLDPCDLDRYEVFLKDLLESHAKTVAQKSQNALKLSRTELAAEKTIRPLMEFCKEPSYRKSRHSHRDYQISRGRKRAPRLLVFTDENSAICQLRVVQPLDALKTARLIDGYSMFSGANERGPDSYDEYDAVYVQRFASNAIIRLLQAQKFLFDIDDLLIGRPAYTSVPLFQTEIIKKLMRMKCTLLVSNHRLYKLLKKYAGCRITADYSVAPNGSDFSLAQIRKPAKPTALIWTSSDYAALTSSAPDIMDALERFLSYRKLPLYMIGKFHDEQSSLAPGRVIHYGRMDFWRHKAFLGAQPTMIAVCPLETHADEATLDFISAKSDLKMVEYGGFGHTGVYSQSPPYADTDLHTGIVTANTSEGWFRALDQCYESAYLRADEEAEKIRDLRGIGRLARETWWPAIEKVILSKPLKKTEVLGALRALDEATTGGRTGDRLPVSKGGGAPKDILLFGAGAGGIHTFGSLPDHYRCIAFVDNDKAKHGKRIYGKPVIPPDQISRYKYDAIIISSVFASAIREQLLEMGIEESKIESSYS